MIFSLEQAFFKFPVNIFVVTEFVTVPSISLSINTMEEVKPSSVDGLCNPIFCRTKLKTWVESYLKEHNDHEYKPHSKKAAVVCKI